MDQVSVKTKVALPSTCSILGILFICFKVFGVVNWSWWIVLLPFWGPIAVTAVIIIIAFIVAAVAISDDD